MRFLTDQDVYGTTVQYLHDLGHDVITARQLGLAQAEDSHLLRIAQKERRLFVTRDRDFGGLVYVEGLGTGVIYLRMLPSTLQAIHSELGRILSSYSEQELSTAFVVVEPGRHRFRRLS